MFVNITDLVLLFNPVLLQSSVLFNGFAPVQYGTRWWPLVKGMRSKKKN